MARNHELLDEDLVLLIRQGNLSASEELFTRYRFYSWRIAYDFNVQHPNSGISLEEYHQAAFTGLPIAIKTYLNLDVGFYIYWKKIAENEVVRYYRDNSYQTNGFDVVLSLDDGKDDGVLLCESVGAIDNSVAIKLFREELRILTEETIEIFKDENDKKIINLYLQEYNIAKIREEIGSTYRHTLYVIKRFQKNFMSILKKRNYN